MTFSENPAILSVQVRSCQEYVSCMFCNILPLGVAFGVRPANMKQLAKRVSLFFANRSRLVRSASAYIHTNASVAAPSLEVDPEIWTAA